MKEETLHPWIEPELEARITALVLGEASDFEREELERLIEEQAELAIFRKRMETVHSLLREVATGETAADDDDWKLGDERRAAVLAVIDGDGDGDGDGEGVEVNNIVKTLTRLPKTKRRSIFKTITQIAAALFVMAIIAGMMMPASYKGVLEKAQKPAYKAASLIDAEAGDRASRSYGVASSLSASTADLAQAAAAEVSVPNPEAASKSALASIQDNIAEGLADSDYRTIGHGGVAISSLDIGDNDFQNGKVNKDSRPHLGFGQAVAIPEQNINVPQSSAGTAKDSTGGSVVIDGMVASNTPGGGQGTIGEGFTGIEKLKKADIPRDRKTQDRMTRSDSKMVRDAEVKSGVDEGNREEISATRQLAEAQSSMARGQIAAVGKTSLSSRSARLMTGGKVEMSNGEPEASLGTTRKNHQTTSKDDQDLEHLKSYPAAQYEWQRSPGQPATTNPDPILNSDLVVTARGRGRSVVEQKRELVTLKVGETPEIPEDKIEVSAGGKITLAKPAKQLGNSDKNVAAKNAPTDSMEAMAKSKEEGFFLRGAKLNDVFSMLAKRGGLNYFHNPALEGSEYLVTGRLQEGGDPLSQMEELGLKYGVTFLQDGKTVQSLKAAEKKPVAPSGLDEKQADEEAFSTFSLHVSDVSFKLAQAALAKGEWPDASKVRIEEFVNAFDYGDPMPDQNEKVACHMEQAIHPFLQQRNLLRVSMRTAAAGRSGDTPLRLTFLLDNSGSMERIDRQETVRRAFALLAQQLKPIDQVTLISFARQPRLLADKVSGAQAAQLVQLVANIPSEGGTNLEAALQLAFEKAREQKSANAQNRVIMLTDGAANLGDADPDSLAQLIETMRDAGIAFDAAGIGAEGLNDEILEALTRKGDGRYYLLDQPEDADEGFARQIAGALRPAAKNVKVQVEFNPDRVGKYKLLGFEKHLLKKEDFRNDKVDAAEMAAAEAGVAVYQFEAKPDGRGDVGSVSVRFLDMSSGQMVEKRWPIPYEADAPRLDEAAPSLRIAATSALLAAKLKGEALGQSVDLKTLANFAAGLPDRYRKTQRIQQLQEMINQARAAGR